MKGPLCALLLLATWVSTGFAQDAGALAAIEFLPNCAVCGIRCWVNDMWLTLVAIVFGDGCSRIILPTYGHDMHLHQY